MRSRIEELELAKKTWQEAISHLKRRAATAENLALEEDDDPSHPTPVLSATEIEGKQTVYGMCIDWAIREQNLLLEQQDPERDKQRERFYRLMAVLAKAEIDRDDHLHSAVLIGRGGFDHPSNQQEVEDLGRVATHALGSLNSSARVGHERSAV